MQKPRIRLTLIDRKGLWGCHYGHRVGDTFGFDAERRKTLSDGIACCISLS